MTKCPSCGGLRFVATPFPMVGTGGGRTGIHLPWRWGVIAAVVLVIASTSVYLWPEEEKIAPPGPRPAPIVGKREDCIGSKNPREIAAGCTIIIEKDGLAGTELAGIYELRGGAYLKTREFAKALADWDAEYRLRPRPEVYLRRAELYMKAAQFDEAAVQLSEGKRILAADTLASGRESAKQIEELRASFDWVQNRLIMKRSVEPFWAAYLTDLEADGQEAYANWEGPPYRVYQKYRKVQ